MDSVRKRKKLLLLLRQYQDAEDVEQYLYLKSPKEREFHVRQIYKERNSKGEFHLLVKEARLMDHELFFEMFRMTPTKYEELLGYVGPHILKDSTRREAISPDERLSVTLRYLVTGDAFGTIGKSYRIDGTTVGRIIKETCEKLWDVLLENGFIDAPDNREKWINVSRDYENKWNFPNCVGAIDGKHVAIQCPPRGGSMYFNYKKFHSIVLMAVVNANYEFIWVIMVALAMGVSFRAVIWEMQ